MSQTSSVKNSRIDLRVTKEQKEILKKAASLRGMALTAYTLFHLLPFVQQEIEEHERLILSHRDRDLFLSMIENPPKLKSEINLAETDALVGIILWHGYRPQIAQIINFPFVSLDRHTSQIKSFLALMEM